MTFRLALLAGGLCAAPALAAPTVDGTRDAQYGSAIVLQQVQTQFGDGNPSGGSELNAAYARVEGGRLYLMFTGNQEANGNKLDVFFDTVGGGENTLSATPSYDFNGTSSNFTGMTFDTGFAADFHLFTKWFGGGTPGPYEANFINRQGGGSAMVPGSTGVSGAPAGLIASGAIAAGNLGPNASGSALTQNLDFAINNNNTAGVTGGTGAADQAAAEAATTGMEFSIALADLGLAANFVGQIKIAAMINNADSNFLSNQILGGLAAGTGNLGGDGAGGFTGTLSGVDFNDFAGEQYFVIRIVPAPATAALLGLGLAAVRRRR